VQVKVVAPSTSANPNNFIAASYDSVKGLTITYAGIDNRLYRIQGASDVVNGPWSDLTLYDRNTLVNGSPVFTNKFNCVNGAVTATDPNAANTSMFYRAVTP
jgi:hypothetical protein